MPNRFKEIRQFKQELQYIRKIGRDRILEKIESFKESDTPSTDILSSILQSASKNTSLKDIQVDFELNTFFVVKEESNLDLERMVDDFMTFFFAGQETTANTLAFSFLEIGRRPDIVQM